MSELIAEQYPDIGLLLPKINDWTKTEIRYGGLVHELTERGLSVLMLESHSSYEGDGVFSNVRSSTDARLGGMHTSIIAEMAAPQLLRDLTMPANPDMPLYRDPKAPILVHTPDINNLLRSKSAVYELMPHVHPITIPRVDAKDVHHAITAIPGLSVVVKPDTGSASEGVMIGKKADIASQFAIEGKEGLYVVQEAIDMSRGLPEEDVQGAHNLRVITIGGKAVFGFIRDDGGASLTLAEETQLFSGRTFKQLEDYSPGFNDTFTAARTAFDALPGSRHTVMAYDLMRGVNSSGEQQEYIVEVNRRPLRNSPLDGQDPGTLRASRAWDKAEAAMLEDALKSK